MAKRVIENISGLGRINRREASVVIYGVAEQVLEELVIEMRHMKKRTIQFARRL